MDDKQVYNALSNQITMQSAVEILEHLEGISEDVRDKIKHLLEIMIMEKLGERKEL